MNAQISLFEQKPQTTNVRELKEAIAKEAIGYTEPVKAMFGMYFEQGLKPENHTNKVTGKPYTNNNVWELEISMLLNGFESCEWATFNQWASVEKRIKKGSKSTKICVAVFGKKEKEGEVKEALKFFKGGSVFNVEQTEEPSPTDEKPEKKETENVYSLMLNKEIKKENPETKAITNFEKKLTRNVASLAKKIATISENLRTKKTHTRRMMSQYMSKLFELNIAEFWHDLQANLVANGVTMDDIKMYEFVNANYYNLVSIRFDSNRTHHYTDGKPYSLGGADKKELENAYNWIEKNLKQDPQAKKQRDIDEAVRKAENLHGEIKGFHSTPKELAKNLVERAEIINGEKILEPSAGIGGIADQVRSYISENNLKDVQIDVCEQQATLREVLELKDYNVIGQDFLELAPSPEYNAVIMNPPFENGLDTEHIQHAFKFVKSGGVLIAIMSGSTMHKSQKKFAEFQKFVYDNNGHTEKIEAGAFKESRTMVATEILILRKN